MTEQKSNDTQTYIVYGIVIVLLAFIKNMSYPNITWKTFGIGIGILTIIFYLTNKNFKQRSFYVSEKKKTKVTPNVALGYTADFMYWIGFPIDFSQTINLQVLEDNAKEGVDKDDTPLLYIHIEQEKTRDKFDIVIKTEYDETYEYLDKLRKKGHKHWLYYENGINNLHCSYVRNLPFIGREKDIFIRRMINSLASKSPQNYAFEYDPNTKKFLGTRLIQDEDPEKKDEDKEEEEK